MGEIFRSAFTKENLIATDTVSLPAGIFQRVGQYKVEAGELITIGYGEQSGQQNAQGRIFAKMMDNSAAPGTKVPGMVRLVIYSPQDRPLHILGEWRTETLESGETDRTKQIPLPENMNWLSEDKKLVLEFKADSTTTLGKANSSITLDMTVEAV